MLLQHLALVYSPMSRDLKDNNSRIAELSCDGMGCVSPT